MTDHNVPVALQLRIKVSRPSWWPQNQLTLVE